MNEDLQIKRSRLQCLVCFEILESVHVHDYRTCDCPNETMIDGGTCYVRYGGADMDKISLLTEYVSKDTFLWGVYDRENGYHVKKTLDELEDSHIQNIVLHLRTRSSNPDSFCDPEHDMGLLTDHFLPELMTRGLEEVTEEIPWN